MRKSNNTRRRTQSAPRRGWHSRLDCSRFSGLVTLLKMGRQHIRNGELVVRQGKTGVQLTLPIRPELQAILDATPSEHMTFLITRTGRPYTAKDLGTQFHLWCKEAGLPNGVTFHGLRATGCTRLADNGCSAHEIAAWSGHMTLKEVERYTRAANQKRLARSAIAREAGETKTETASG